MYKYKWRHNENERPKGVCYDCKIPYNSFQDMIISDELWEEINPTNDEGSGLLCPKCITNRLKHLGLWSKNVLYKMY